MKTKLIILSLIVLFSGFNAKAQLLKKLKDAVKQGIEAVDGTDKDTKGETTEDSKDRKPVPLQVKPVLPMACRAWR